MDNAIERLRVLQERDAKIKAEIDQRAQDKAAAAAPKPSLSLKQRVEELEAAVAELKQK